MNTTIFPSVPAGVATQWWGWDIKQMYRIGQIGASTSKAERLFLDEPEGRGFNMLRVPIFGSKGTEGSADGAGAHPACGQIDFNHSPDDGRDYTGVLSDIVAAKAVRPGVNIFASLKLNVGGVPLPDWAFTPLDPSEQDEACTGQDSMTIDGVISKKCAVVDAERYACLLYDHLVAFEERGVIFDALGLENETGWITVLVWIQTLAALRARLAEAGMEDLIPSKLPIPENYHPNWEWLEEYRATDDTLGSIAGTHFYGVYRPKPKIRNKFLRFTNAAELQGLPKWHTEIHTHEAEEEDEIAMYPNDIRFAEDVVNQFADYADQGLTGFVPWAYPNEKSAPKNFGHLLKMEYVKTACVGCSPVLTVDRDGLRTQQGMLSTRAWCKATACRLWVTNAGDASADIQETYHLAGAELAGDVTYRQWTGADLDADGFVTDLDAIQREATTLLPGSPTSFGLTLPRESWTIFEFEVSPTASAASTVVSFDAAEDTYVQEKVPDATNGQAATLTLSGKNNKEQVAVLKFDVEVPSDHYVHSATLMLSTPVDGSEALPDLLVYPAPSSWTEDSATWATLDPTSFTGVEDVDAVGAAVAVLGETNISVTSAVRGSGHVNLALQTTGTAEYLINAMGSAGAPRLLVELVTVPSSPPSLAPPPSPPCGPSVLVADAPAGSTTVSVDTYACGLQPGDTIAIGSDTDLVVTSLGSSVAATTRAVRHAPRRLQDTTLTVSFSPAIVNSYSAGESLEHTPQSGGAGHDPHLHFAHGGRADFRGRQGGLYSFFSAPRLGVNVKTETATFTLNGGQLQVDGSFITEVHLVALVGGAKRKRATASFWASELSAYNTGWRVINGTCGGRRFVFGLAGARACEELAIKMDYSSAAFSLLGWTISVRGNHVYGWIAGPKHRLDVSFSAADGEAPARDLPHGIIGQSFASVAPREGRVDVYPAAGRFTTSSMAEGAIEGEAALYEVASPYEPAFAFSRFDAPDSSPGAHQVGTTKGAGAVEAAASL